jgi:2-oxoglutarate ferredoxin oxidoreductase subunit alpha
MTSRLVRKIRENTDDIINVAITDLDDAEIAVVAYGISARSAKRAVREARLRGIRAGFIKLNTIWPFPEKLIGEVAGIVKAMIMPEINYGQMVLELQRASMGRCLVQLVPHAGGGIISPTNILNTIEAVLKER